MEESVEVTGRRLEDSSIQLSVAGVWTCMTCRDVKQAVIEGSPLSQFLILGPSVAFDLSQLTYIDSCGLSEFMAWLNYCRSHNIRTELLAATPPIRNLLSKTGMCCLFNLNPCL